MPAAQAHWSRGRLQRPQLLGFPQQLLPSTSLLLASPTDLPLGVLLAVVVGAVLDQLLWPMLHWHALGLCSRCSLPWPGRQQLLQPQSPSFEERSLPAQLLCPWPQPAAVLQLPDCRQCCAAAGQEVDQVGLEESWPESCLNLVSTGPTGVRAHLQRPAVASRRRALQQFGSALRPASRSVPAEHRPSWLLQWSWKTWILLAAARAAHPPYSVPLSPPPSWAPDSGRAQAAVGQVAAAILGCSEQPEAALSPSCPAWPPMVQPA
mmetsp:Transcript_102628/g.187422  ORF Transcript_102628/g.187422 Transcript_102628/m.187422 type:complete len:264 (-) Transcript_102628:506-1297(-)